MGNIDDGINGLIDDLIGNIPYSGALLGLCGKDKRDAKELQNEIRDMIRKEIRYIFKGDLTEEQLIRTKYSNADKEIARRRKASADKEFADRVLRENGCRQNFHMLPYDKWTEAEKKFVRESPPIGTIM